MDNERPPGVIITPSFPFELHHIKALYLNHQYKECARRCEELLVDHQDKPAHIIFLRFYTGLSHQGLAEIMHVFSVWRLPTITAAESAYRAALESCSNEEHLISEKSILPKLAVPDQPRLEPAAPGIKYIRKASKKPSLSHLGPGFDLSRDNSSGERSERINFSWPRALTPMSDDTVQAIEYNVIEEMMTPLEDPFTTSSSESPVIFQNTPMRTHNLKANKGALDSPHPPSPTRSYRATSHPQSPTRPSKSLSPNPTIPSTHTTYLTHLRALHIQLTTHLTQLLELKQTTIAEQASRTQRQSGTISSTTGQKTKLPQSRSFWSFKDPEAEKKEKMTRVEEGRARGWRTERFEPEKYVGLAEVALAELEG